MRHARRQSGASTHYGLILNSKAANYDPGLIKQLIRAIKRAGGYYTVFEPESAMELARQAETAAGLKKLRGPVSPQVARRSNISALVACGGDSTFNLVARAALRADLPLGILPLGRFNNIARSLLGTDDTAEAIAGIIRKSYRTIDSGIVGNQRFWGSVAIGFIPQMALLLEDRKKPKLGLGWSQLGAKAAAACRPRKRIIKVDAFRFETSSTMINVNLLPYALGLPLSPASIADDCQAEVIFDVAVEKRGFASYCRKLHRRKYQYGQDIRLFRGKIISIQPIAEETLYIDGELVEMQSNIVEIRIDDKSLKVFS